MNRLGPTLLLAFLLLLAGCFRSSHGGDPPPPDRCDAPKACLSVDTLGCCTGASTTVSVCEACPPGTVERASCRMSGCDDPCGGSRSEGRAGPDGAGAPLPSVLCYQDLGGGCCGGQVFNADACGECPVGSIPSHECTNYEPSCGCGASDTQPILPPDGGSGAPPMEPDAGVPDEDGSADEPPTDAGDWDFAASCYGDLGGGCCGVLVSRDPCSGQCPVGSVEEWMCTAYTSAGGTDRWIIEQPLCRQDVGGGCCGDPVEPNACGECAGGSLPEWDCTSYTPECS